MAVESPPPAAFADPPVPRAPALGSQFLTNRLGLTGAVIIVSTVFLAVFARWLPVADPNRQFARGLTSEGMPVPPGGHFLLGTDNLGRDMLSRLIYGSRVSLEVGLFAIFIALGVGVVVGLTAGYGGGWIDTALMRFTDVVMTIPSILLAIVLAAILKPSLADVFIAVGFASWTGIARIVRGQVLQIKEKEYIEAAVAIGCSPLRIALRHVLPNILPLIVVLGTFGIAGTILLDAGLSYLGLGVPPPTPSWGKMIAEGQDYYLSAPWILLEPGLAASLVVVGFYLLGQSLQEMLDPYRLQ
jgi:peptide/nickel transport system permease protein